MLSVTGCLRDREGESEGEERHRERESASRLIKMATGGRGGSGGEDERWMVDTKLS